MRAQKVVIWSTVVVVLLAAGGAYLTFGKRTKQPTIRYETATVDRGPIVSKVTASGTLSAVITVQVGSQVSGRLKEILVDYNAPVKKGQVIARIDPQLFQAALEQARANFVAAQGDLARGKAQALDAERQAQRAAGLLERKLIAQAEYDTTQSTADAAKAQVEASAGRVEQARAALNQAEVNFAYTTIASPINGVVISRNVDVGQTVAASLQAPTLFVLAEDLRKMQVDTSVAESDIGKIQDSMKATFTVDAFPNERFTGSVRQIRNSPTTVQNVVTYDAVIDVDNPELKLRPGMTANVTFVYADRPDALRIPNSALRFRPPAEMKASLEGGAPEATSRPGRRGGNGPQSAGASSQSAPASASVRENRTIWVQRDDGPRPVSFAPGITDGTLTEVLGDMLREGDKVIIDAAVQGAAKSGASQSSGGGPGMRRIF